jgi:hypothetical protein
MAVDNESGGDDQAFLDDLRRAREEARRVPDFFVVGHAKCGTTALCEMLKAHPQVFLPRFKETQFLSRAPHHRIDVQRRRAPQRPQTLEEYLALFEQAPAELRAGEGSTEYLRTPVAASHIHALCPEARIVAAFREPASFLRSLHLQLLEVGTETERDFARALALEEPRARGERIPAHCAWPPALLYSRHVNYAEQLRAYEELFGSERVHVMIYDDFRADNERAVREVFRFLAIDDSRPIEAVEANPTVRVRSRRAEDLLGSVASGSSPLARAAGATVRTVTSERMRRSALRLARRAAVDSAPEPPDPALMEDLRRRFAGEVVALGEHLDRDLVSLWGYGALV